MTTWRRSASSGSPRTWPGWDVVKAVALGARAVMIGRAYLWGLAANGQAGVENVLDILRGGIDSVTPAAAPCPSRMELTFHFARASVEADSVRGDGLAA